MGNVKVLLLVLVVWTFNAVCEEMDDIPITCKNVTAHMGDKINLTCTVSYPIKGCCAVWYKFMTTAADDDPIICREDFRRDSCIQESSLSCPYTAKKAMTTNFIFFLQTTCGRKKPVFSVNITGAGKGDPGESNTFKGGEVNESTGETSGLDNSSVAVLIFLLCCFVIVAVALFLWMRRKPSRSPHDYNMATCEQYGNISEHSDREAMLKETSVNVQIEKPQCQCNCNQSITSI